MYILRQVGFIYYVFIYMYVYVYIYIYTPCSGQGLRRGRVLVRGQVVYWSGAPSGRVLVRGSVRGRVWSGVWPSTGLGPRRGLVLVRGRLYIIYTYVYTYLHTHTHTHTHTHGGFFSFSADVSAWPDAVSGVSFAGSTLGFGLGSRFSWLTDV